MVFCKWLFGIHKGLLFSFPFEKSIVELDKLMKINIISE